MNITIFVSVDQLYSQMENESHIESSVVRSFAFLFSEIIC